MPTYIVTDPETGKKVRLTGDSPPTEQELEQIFASLPQGRQQVPRDERSIGQRMRDEAIGGNATGALYGMAKPFIGAAQLGMRAGEAVFGTQEGRTPLSERVAGGLQSFEQARAQAGGSSIPVMAGQVASGAGLTAKIAPAAGFIGRALQGVGMGGAMGAVEPVTSTDSNFDAAKALQVGTGAGAGGALSLAGSAAGTIVNRFRPELGAGRIANELAGDRQPQVLQALRNTPAGSVLTAGQAAAPARSAEFSALQRRAAQVRPSEYDDIAQAQNAARASALGNIAGTTDDIANAERARSAATEPLYTAAKQSDIPVDSLRSVRLIERVIESRAGRPKITNVLSGVRQTLLEAYPAQDRAKDSWNAVRSAVSGYQGTAPRELIQARQILNQVKNLDSDPYTAIIRLRELRPQDAAARDQISLAIRNLEIPDEVATQNARQLINASRNISDLIDERDLAGRAVNREMARELMAIKKSIDGQIKRAIPQYGQAQKLFADLSKPVDRMKVGQYIQDRLIPAINDAGADAPQRATVFANAMRDMNETVRAATGFRRGGGIADLMTPDEMATLRGIGAELSRDVDLQRIGQAGGRRASEAIGDMFSETAPNALSRPLMIINAILRRTGVGAGERTMNVLSQKMQDPAAMAEIMQAATNAERRAIERGIMLYMTSGAVSSPDDALGWATRTTKGAMNLIPGDQQ